MKALTFKRGPVGHEENKAHERPWDGFYVVCMIEGLTDSGMVACLRRGAAAPGVIGQLAIDAVTLLASVLLIIIHTPSQFWCFDWE